MRSQLHGIEQWVGPDTAQRLTAYSTHLRAIETQSAHRKAPAPQQPRAAPKEYETHSRYENGEDRQEDGLLTVLLAHVVELVDIPHWDFTSKSGVKNSKLDSMRH